MYHHTCLVAQSCLTLCNLLDCSPPSWPWGCSRQEYEWTAMPSSRASSQRRDHTQVTHISANSLPSEPPGKPNNTGVGSLSLLQGIFPTQESNQGLLHCRWILYKLSYQGRPMYLYTHI